MRKILITAAVAVTMLAVSGATGAKLVYAKSDKAARAQVQECKKLADPKLRDECVKKAGKGAEKKADAKASKGVKKDKSK